MGTTAWTEEDRAAVWRLLRAAKDRWYIAGEDDRRDYDDMRADAVLDLLAGLRQRIADELRDLDVKEIGRYEPCADVEGTRKEAVSVAMTVPLLPSDGPPEREGR